MKAVIMAGGFGTRIQPLTDREPKPMLDVVNIPMMEHILRKTKKAGITEIVILLYFKPEVIKNHFGNGEEFGVNISYVLPDGDFGTAGAVGQAREILKDDSFIIISGDLVTDFDLNEIIAFHNKKNSKLTITLTPVENPLQFGVVITDENNQITKFLEKPSWGEVFSDTINTGIYVLESDILDYIPVNENYDFSKDLFPSLMKEGINLWGCPVEGYWRDVGNPQSYREVHEDILKGEISFDFEGELIEFENGKLYSKTKNLPDDLTIIGNVVIDEDVTILENVTLANSVIGKNVKIGKSSNIENSVIWRDVNIGKKCNINRAVICNDTKLKSNVDIKKGAIIAQGCKILSKVEITKDITIWPNKTIEEGAIVSQNVVWGDSYKANIFNKGAVIGTANIELTGERADKIAEAFASILPEGSKVYVSRDYHQASRMIKRFVVGGILAVGVDIIDLKAVPANVMRHRLLNDDEAVAGVHVRQSIENPYKTEISFYTNEGMLIDSKITDSVQRIYFREQFRRVNFDKIGVLTEVNNANKEYRSDLERLISSKNFDENLNVAIDLMYGMTADICPDIFNRMNIKNIMLNAYPSQDRLVEISTEIEESKAKLSEVVKSLSLSLGVLMYPNGQKLDLIDNSGDIIDGYMLLLSVFRLLNKEDKKMSIYLPAWAPDIIDNELNNLEFSRGKLMGKKEDFLKDFDLIADVKGSFAFTEFGLNRDAIYSSLKIIELLSKHNLTLKEVKESIPEFFYKHLKVSAPSSKKGTIMRKFLENAKEKNYSHDDGIKIYENDNSWVLMIPDDYEDEVHLYIQASSKAEGIRIKEEYSVKIENWIKEK
jgi:mannose-1-phosphate guanylyltransferase/phosphomannomutase